MKHKKWVITLLVSIALIAASIVFTFVFLIPKIGRTKLLDTVLSGDREKTREEFRELTNDEKEDLKEDIEDIVVYTHNRYMDGKISYEEMFSVYYSVETIKNYRNMTEKSFEIVQPPKLIESYEKAALLYDAKAGNYGDDFNKEREVFQNLYNCRDGEGNTIRTYWDSEVEEAYKDKMKTELDAYLKEKYDAYFAGTLDYEKADAYVKTAYSLWHSEYVNELSDKLYYDKFFREQLEEVDERASKKDYFSALRYMDMIRENYGAKASYIYDWKSVYDEKYKELEETAKSYYTEQAIEYIKEGDTYQADYLVRQLKAQFGDDFDTSAIDAARPAEWIDPYLKVMKNWKSNLKTDYNRYRQNAGIYDEYDFDEVCPDQILLMDLDSDGIPEMILQNDKKDAFIYSYHDGNTWFLGGLIDYKGIREPGEFLFATTIKDEDGYSMTYRIMESVKEHQLRIDLCIGHMVKGDQHWYYEGKNLNSAGDIDDFTEIDETTYNTKKDEFDAMQKADNMPAGAAIDGYEEYIRSWK